MGTTTVTRGSQTITGADRTILTSAADTTLTLTSASDKNYAIAGSGAMYVIVLPDATTLTVGAEYSFQNQSSEFVGVRNSDSTVWHRLPPRATLNCSLITQVSAPGVWYSMVHDPAVGDPAYGLSVFEDFLAYATASFVYGPTLLRGVTSGAGATADITVSNVARRQGRGRNQTGTTATGYSLYSGANAGDSTLLGSGCVAVEGSINLLALSTVAEEYIYRFGFGDNITGGAHTEGGYILYDRLNLGTNYQIKSIKTAGGAGTTTNDSGVAVSASITVYTKLRVEISSSGARLDAFINNALVSPAGGQGNLPAVTTAGIRIVNFGITKSASAGVSSITYTDYVRIQSYPTTLR